MIRFQIRRIFGVSLGLILGISLLLAAAPVLAQDQAIVDDGQGMEAHLFRSAVDTKGHFTVDATPLLPHLAISLSLMLDFGFNNYFAVEADGEVYDRTKLDTYINSVLMFNLGLFDMIAVGLQIPLVIPTGTGYDLDPETEDVMSSEWSTKGGIADIGIHTKLRWLRADKHPLGLGTVIMYQFPASAKPEWRSARSLPCLAVGGYAAADAGRDRAGILSEVSRSVAGCE